MTAVLGLLMLVAAREVPPLPPPTPFTPPAVEAHALPGGAPVWVVERPSVPLVRVEVSWRQGYLSQPDPAAAMLAGVLADESPGIDWAALEEMGGVAQLGAGAQRAWADIEVLSGHEADAIAWLSEAVASVGFPARTVRRQRRRWASQRRQSWRSIGRVHSLLLSTLLFDDAHVLGFRPTASDWRRVSPRDVRRAWETMLADGAVGVVVTGATTADAVLGALAEGFGAYRGEGTPPQVPLAAWPDAVRVEVADFPGAQRALISHTRPGPPMRAPEDVAAAVANHILGGAFTSRLSARLREQDGYVYEIDSQLLERPGSGRVEITASVAVDDAGRAMTAIAEVLAGMGSAPPTAAEVSASVRALRLEAAGGWLRLATLSRPLGLAMLYGQGPDALARRMAGLESVSVEAVQQAAADWLAEPAGLWVVTGDAVALSTVLPEAGWQLDAVQVRSP